MQTIQTKHTEANDGPNDTDSQLELYAERRRLANLYIAKGMEPRQAKAKARKDADKAHMRAIQAKALDSLTPVATPKTTLREKIAAELAKHTPIAFTLTKDRDDVTFRPEGETVVVIYDCRKNGKTTVSMSTEKAREEYRRLLNAGYEKF